MNRNEHFEDLSGSFSATYCESPAPPRNSFHIHDAFELMLIDSDGVVLQVNNETYSIPFGSVLLFSPCDLHLIRFGGEGDYKRFVVWFKEDFLKEFEAVKSRLLKCFYLRGFEKANMLCLEEDEPETVRTLLERLTKNKDDLFLCKFILGELLTTVNGLYGAREREREAFSDEYNAVFRAIGHVRENFQNKVSPDELERLTGTNKRRLCEGFLRLTGMTTGQYVLNYRLTAAKAYLVQGMSVSEVCERTGFDNFSNFSRTFKNHVGLSPKQYAMKNK